eukprot:692784-Alexandrium_andersonii.AAC.1
MENFPKCRFLMAWQDERLYLRAAQAHSGGIGAMIDMSRALEEIQPGHEKWCSVGLHGTRVESVQSIIRTGLDT